MTDPKPRRDPNATPFVGMPVTEINEVMKAAARAAEAAFPPGIFFAIIATDQQGPGQYISNADPAGMIPVVRQTAARVAETRALAN